MIDCRFFNGYKPCAKHDQCDAQCPSLSIATTRVLLVHLEALGAVLRSTSLLAALKRKYPNSHITWVTQRPADQLLANNPFIDRVLTTEPMDLLALSALEFDVGLCIDKSLKAAGVLRQTNIRHLFGFDVDARTGAVLPATKAAQELWELGLNDHRKFQVNTKSEVQLTREALELPSRHMSDNVDNDDYVVRLSLREMMLARDRRIQWTAGGAKWIVGINTGCSPTIPYKKLTVEAHRRFVEELSRRPDIQVVLLGGGAEDELRNQRIAHGLRCIRSPALGGLRDGLASVQACDVVVSGDSLGLHMAIGLKKWVVAWFGPTCAPEIELYGRGTKVLTQAPCAPCWKRHCEKPVMCYDQVSLGEIIKAVNEGLDRLATGFCVPHIVHQRSHDLERTRDDVSTPNTDRADSLRRRSPAGDSSTEEASSP